MFHHLFNHLHNYPHFLFYYETTHNSLSNLECSQKQGNKNKTNQLSFNTTHHPLFFFIHLSLLLFVFLFYCIFMFLLSLYNYLFGCNLVCKFILFRFKRMKIIIVSIITMHSRSIFLLLFSCCSGVTLVNARKQFNTFNTTQTSMIRP